MPFERELLKLYEASSDSCTKISILPLSILKILHFIYPLSSGYTSTSVFSSHASLPSLHKQVCPHPFLPWHFHMQETPLSCHGFSLLVLRCMTLLPMLLFFHPVSYISCYLYIYLYLSQSSYIVSHCHIFCRRGHPYAIHPSYISAISQIHEHDSILSCQWLWKKKSPWHLKELH